MDKTMEDTACNLCGSRETQLVQVAHVQRFGRKTPFRLVRCRHCELVYVNPRPDKNGIQEYYTSDYQPRMRTLLCDGLANPVLRIGFNMIRRRRLPPLVTPGKALDIGCASGLYLEWLRSHGWEVQGVEVDPEVAQDTRSRLGVPVHTGGAEEVMVGLPSAEFDVVTMWHVIEHFHDPLKVLKDIHRVLKPGGLLMMEVPNYRCPLASVFKEHWVPLEIPRHLYHFTPATLRAMVGKAGFRLANVKGVPAPEAIAWSFHSFWNRHSRNSSEDPLPMNPLVMGLLFPFSWLMARFRLSDHMAAIAVRAP